MQAGRILTIAGAVGGLLIMLGQVFAQGTAFTYQGRLNDGVNPATGSYDLRFALFDAATAGTQQGNALTNSPTAVSNGVFTVTLDFGYQFPGGASRWLEIGVRTNGGAAFSTLAPRQALTPVPYAMFAENANVSGAQGNAVNFSNGANNFDGTFSGLFFGSTFVGGNFTGNFIGSGNALIDVWHTGGNFGTTAGPNFLGTTDNQPLELRVNNARILRLEPDGRAGLNAGNLIAGDPSNTIFPPGGGNVIAGGGYPGYGNTIYSNSAGVFIGGGSGNQIGPNAFDSVIAGGNGNVLQSSDAVIAGGTGQLVQTNSGYSFIGGGNNNIAGSGWDVIAGGFYNTNNGFVSFIGNGDFNIHNSSSWYSFIGGGFYNSVSGYASFIGGGGYNSAGPQFSFIGGGYYNVMATNADFSTIAGGHNHRMDGNVTSSTIGGGYNNVMEANVYRATIAGGNGNIIRASSYQSTIGGGAYNTVDTNSPSSTIAGGFINSVGTNSVGSVIAGGQFNTVSSNSFNAVVAGGFGNTVGPNGYQSFIGAGFYNVADNGDNIVVGGYYNTNHGSASIVGGGNYNYIGPAGYQSVLGGGYANYLNGPLSVIGGGWSNIVFGYSAVIPGGVSNAVYANYGFAAGQQAQVYHEGSFVWSDNEPGIFFSTSTNQFNVRADGGVRFVTGGAGITLDGQPVLGASAFAPAGGSPNYIQNQNAPAQVASFNINGSMTGDSLVANSANVTAITAGSLSANSANVTTITAGSLTANTLNAATGSVTGTLSVSALNLTNSLRVPGAGIGTTTPAFVHRATGSNIDPIGPHRTTISNPLCDGDPNAILIITHNYNPGLTGNVLDTNATSVFYNSGLGKWQIYHDNFVAMATNSAWNVLIIKP
jgi:hypothetical protein